MTHKGRSGAYPSGLWKCADKLGVRLFSGLASHSAGAPADGSAGLTDGGSGYALATDHCPTRAASQADLSGHFVRMMKRSRC